MKKMALGLVVLLSIGGMITGCGDEKKDAPKSDAKPAAEAVSVDLTGAKDGTYAADSSEHAQLGHSHVELTIENGAITKVVHTGFDKDGKVKDENYGADKPEGVRKKAQNAYKAIGSYASQLESKKDLAKVDAIAGATVSYDQFNEAVAKAVEAAKK
ncbi:MAG: FMN-binding protein [Centipeda sp. (in: firmicutes)]|uniref:FMN-binding protein n=1 Tax=Selenomonas sp. oral taxon 920 TaxID=1884263 RepID=UPI000840A09C|nr:FMN-binding protein [Selenomonas sp. oral taxon 920]AOH47705.1 FMN-binding domain-containing protein [Selenomonas sp. oral taxon 920]